MEITEEKFRRYEKVRQSGVTNMFNATLVCNLSGLTNAECLDIMKNYDDYNKKWPEIRVTNYPRTIGIVNLEQFGGEIK